MSVIGVGPWGRREARVRGVTWRGAIGGSVPGRTPDWLDGVEERRSGSMGWAGNQISNRPSVRAPSGLVLRWAGLGWAGYQISNRAFFIFLAIMCIKKTRYGNSSVSNRISADFESSGFGFGDNF